MIRGNRVVLRAARRSDLPFLEPILQDMELQISSSRDPWIPIPLEAGEARYDQRMSAGEDGRTAYFIIADADDSEVQGHCSLSAIDLHNRKAVIGIELLPGARGRGMGVDAVRLLCDYGFRVRGLNRLQLDTLDSNVAMRRVATAAGFAQEGRTCEGAWVNGRFEDEVLFGLTALRWSALGLTPRPTGSPAGAE